MTDAIAAGVACIGQCSAGFTNVGLLCWQSSCPSGYVDLGAGCVETGCPSGQDLIGALCYPQCKSGYSVSAWRGGAPDGMIRQLRGLVMGLSLCPANVTAAGAGP